MHAANAEAALEAIGKDRSLDLVFSDIVMPGPLSGLDLARRLRQLRPGLPVILTTGYSAALQSAAPEGFTLLTKPYDLAALGRSSTKPFAHAARRSCPCPSVGRNDRQERQVLSGNALDPFAVGEAGQVE